MIRNDVEKKLRELLTYEFLMKLKVMEHTSTICNRLEVYTDGSICLTEEPTDNTWHTNTVELWKHYCSCGCNCDWCDEWENGSDIKNEYDTVDDFLEDCIRNNEGVSDLEDSIWERFEEIPENFFDDEEE